MHSFRVKEDMIVYSEKSFARFFYILFCNNPLNPSVPDPDFMDEYTVAGSLGLKTLLFSYEDLTANNADVAVKNIKSLGSIHLVIYRGWMLTPLQYQNLYEALAKKNYELLNTPQEYQNCHYLPDSLKFIKAFTPDTVYEKYTGSSSVNRLVEKAKIFGDKPVILKDYVKSEKHLWETACFVPRASNTEKLKSTISCFLENRGSYLNEGLCIREYRELMPLAVHSKSGMPLSEEYRLFFFNNRLLGVYNYWEEGEYAPQALKLGPFYKLARFVESNFFTMDIARINSCSIDLCGASRRTKERLARTNDNKLIIIELGDGQVSGLPKSVDVFSFYKKLAEMIEGFTLEDASGMKVRYIGESYAGFNKKNTFVQDFEHGQIYEVVRIDDGFYAVIDESDEDYLYSPNLFEIVSLWE